MHQSSLNDGSLTKYLRSKVWILAGRAECSRRLHPAPLMRQWTAALSRGQEHDTDTTAHPAKNTPLLHAMRHTYMTPAT